MRTSVYESERDAKQKAALLAYAKAEGIRLTARIIDGLTDHLRTQNLDDEDHVQRAIARIRGKEIPLTEDGIRAQVAQAVEMTRKDAVLPAYPDCEAYQRILDKPLHRYAYSPSPRAWYYHRPKVVHHTDSPWMHDSIYFLCGNHAHGTILTNRLPKHLGRCPKCFKDVNP